MPIPPQPGKREWRPVLPQARPTSATTPPAGWVALSPLLLGTLRDHNRTATLSPPHHAAPHGPWGVASALPSTSLAPLPRPPSPTLSPTDFCLPHLPWHDHCSSPFSSAGQLLFAPQGPTRHLLLVFPSQTTRGREGSCPFGLGCCRPRLSGRRPRAPPGQDWGLAQAPAPHRRHDGDLTLVLGPFHSGSLGSAPEPEPARKRGRCPQASLAGRHQVGGGALVLLVLWL